MLNDLAAESGRSVDELIQTMAEHITDRSYFINNVVYVKSSRVLRQSHLLQLGIGFDARYARTDLVATLEVCLRELSALLYELFPRRTLGLHITSPSLLQTPFLTPFATNHRFLVKSVMASLETVMNSTHALDLCALHLCERRRSYDSNLQPRRTSISRSHSGRL